MAFAQLLITIIIRRGLGCAFSNDATRARCCIVVPSPRVSDRCGRFVVVVVVVVFVEDLVFCKFRNPVPAWYKRVCTRRFVFVRLDDRPPDYLCDRDTGGRTCEIGTVRFGKRSKNIVIIQQLLPR